MDDNRIVLLHKGKGFFLARRKFNQYLGKSVGRVELVNNPTKGKWLVFISAPNFERVCYHDSLSDAYKSLCLLVSIRDSVELHKRKV